MFTTQQMDDVASYALDFHVKGEAFQQTIQDKPLLSALRAKQKSFPGGKGKITIPVNADALDSDVNFFKGYSFDDTVTFQNPNSVKRAEFGYHEIHAGITITHTELKQDGIIVVDSAFGETTKAASDAETISLTNMLEHKLGSMSEGWSRKMNQMCWLDGTQDSGKQAAGVLFYVVDDPTLGTVGGLARASYTWWRNRVLLNVVAGGDTLCAALRSEARQLRRYGGVPDLILCGSKFLDALEAEIAGKSTFSVTGISGNRKIDSPVVSLTGVGTFVYDPTLDDLQGILGGAIDYAKRCYFIDTKALGLHVMDGEDNKVHAPARPETKYALYRSMTWTGGSAVNRMNSCGVYSID